MQTHSIVIFAILSSACGGSRDYCTRPSAVPRSVNVPHLGPGEYRLTLFAECGSRKGSAAEGTLNLVPARATDTSTATGEVVQDILGTPPLYGWTNLDFRRVGAPMCAHTSPASRDPVRPGVLVLNTAEVRAIDPAIEVRAAPQTMAIGAVSNLRSGAIVVDGCGIGLLFEGWDGKCYRGSWDHRGIVADGTGTFHACPVQTPRP